MLLQHAKNQHTSDDIFDLVYDIFDLVDDIFDLVDDIFDLVYGSNDRVLTTSTHQTWYGPGPTTPRELKRVTRRIGGTATPHSNHLSLYPVLIFFSFTTIMKQLVAINNTSNDWAISEQNIQLPVRKYVIQSITYCSDITSHTWHALNNTDGF